MMNRSLRICYFICIVLLLTSCSTTKFVPDGEYLLDKVEIVSDNRDYKSADLKSYLRQQPNFKVFGLMKWQLFVYDWSGKNEKKWINKQLRRIGEPPVVLDTMLVEQSAMELERFYINKGYVHADVSTTIDTARHKKAVVTYHIKANDPYRIRNYTMKFPDPKIDSLAHLKAPRRSPLASAFRSSQEEYNQLVKEGTLFDRDILDKERERITTLLRWNGYYGFNRDYLGYIADSSFNQNVVDLDMSMKPYRKVLPNGSVEDQPHRQVALRTHGRLLGGLPTAQLLHGQPQRLTDDPRLPHDADEPGHRDAADADRPAEILEQLFGRYARRIGDHRSHQRHDEKPHQARTRGDDRGVFQADDVA